MDAVTPTVAPKNTPEFPANQRNDLLNHLLADLTRFAESEGVAHHVAFTQQALDWTGVGEGDQTYRTDGRGDRGLDCYHFGHDSLEIYQFKSQDFLADHTKIDQMVASTSMSSPIRTMPSIRTAP